MANGWDESALLEKAAYDHIRGFCRCPHCQNVWIHKETGNDSRDRKTALARYAGPTQCPECFTWSKPHRNRGILDAFRTTHRELCAPPEKELRRSREVERE